MKIFLDDEREPDDIDRINNPDDWVVVRDVESFKDVVNNHGGPITVSFDHDLGDDVPNGMEAARWLTENAITVQEYFVHSANPVGAENIRSLMGQWVRFCSNHSEDEIQSL